MGKIARLLIDRPERRNAMTQAMWETLPALVGEAMADDSVRVLILGSATPGMFCAGADIGEFAQCSGDADWRVANQAAIRASQYALAHADKPVIAAIEGDCVGGGCGLAIACDLRIATHAARLGITPAKLGIVYSLFDTKLLIDLVGPARAKRILFTGRAPWRAGRAGERSGGRNCRRSNGSGRNAGTDHRRQRAAQRPIVQGDHPPHPERPVRR